MNTSRRLGRWAGHCVLTLIFLAGASDAFAQVTGSLTGTVGDNVGVVPGVTVTATEPTLGVTRSTTSNESGLFRLLSLPPGNYTIKVTMDGFKPITMNDIKLSSAEIRDLGRLTLAAGGVSESITITAEVTPVQTASSSRASTLTGDTLTTIQVKGRDLFGLLRTLPGVTDANQNRDYTSWTSANQVSINGSLPQAKSVVVDGFAANDEGGCGTAYVNPNIDSVGEVQVIANGFTAENGRNNGGLIQITTKSGTNQLKGSAWYNGRRDRFNSNDFFRIKNNSPKPLMSIDISGYSIGGPIVLPGYDARTSNKKIFFFASQEFTDDKRPSTQTRTNLPTAAERNGDFSDTRLSTASQNGQIQPIIDPNNGQQFPGNIIPANRINPLGQAMLNLMPLPNGIRTTVSSDLYKSNDLQDITPQHTRGDFVGRVDVTVSQNHRASFRWLQDTDSTTTFNAIAPGIGSVNNYVPGKVVTGALSSVLGPSMVNELTVGFGYNRWGYKIGEGGSINPDDYTSQYQQAVGIFPPRIEAFGDYGTPQLGLNQKDEYPYLPDMLYSGGDRAGLASYRPSTGNGPLPRLNISERTSVQDDLSLTRGRHNYKFGVYTEFSIKTEPGSAGYTGSYNFAADATNPLSTGNGYANALLGNFTSYSELSNRVDAQRRHWQTDGYAQDSWRLNSRLTLDYGVRVSHSGPLYEARNQNSGFDPTEWSTGDAPLLYYPACKTGVPGNQSCSSANRAAVDPSNPSVYLPSYLVGNIVPGSGSIDNGIIYNGLPDQGHPGVYFTLPALTAAPRVGMAWDINGDGKSALRASTGVFYNFPRASDVYSFTGGPDISLNRVINNSTFADIVQAGEAGAGFNSTPASSNRVNPDYKLEKSYQVNTAYQRDIGFSTVAEVAYVGNFGRNGRRQKTINNVPLYAYASPAAQFNGDAINANFLRQPYPGQGNIQQLSSEEVSLNYNAMQLSVQRRLSHGLQLGMAYTLARGLGMTGWDYYTELLGGQEALDQRYYGPTTNDRKHNLVFNYSYNVPTFSKVAVLKQIVSDWQVSGVTQFLSGTALTPGCNLQSGVAGIYNTDPTLSGGTLRCQMTGQSLDDFVVDTSKPEEEQLHFNPAAFTRVRVPVGSSTGAFGDEPTGQLRNPSWWNQDFTLARRIPIQIGRGGSVRVQFQVFNLFNAVQFTTLDVTQSFNAAGVNQNATIGQYKETTTPRQMGLTLRFDY